MPRQIAGAYEQSLESLTQAFETAQKAAASGRPHAALQAGELTAICDAYYQRLVHGDQFKIARQAFQLALEHTKSPAVQEFLTSRLKRLDLVGKPAPPIEGTDLDGKPFSLASLKGKVVLVVFWASWCLPSAAEVEWLQQAVRTHRSKGFEVVGINLDTLQEGGQKLETVLPNVRRFLIEQNVRWPNLVNGPGAQDLRQGVRCDRHSRQRADRPGRHDRPARPGAQEPGSGDRPGARSLGGRRPHAIGGGDAAWASDSYSESKKR